MSKQCLDVQQMQHLQEMGLKLKPSLVHYYKIINIDSGKWYLSVTTGDISKDNPTYQYIPAYTLHDVLDALPIQIEIPLHPECGKYELRIKRMVFNTGKVMHAVVYEKSDYINWFVLQSHEELIDAAYEMLCWAIENKFVETNKNE